MFALILLLGGIIAFFGGTAGIVSAIVFDSDLWVNVSAGLIGLSVGQILAFVLIKE